MEQRDTIDPPDCERVDASTIVASLQPLILECQPELDRGNIPTELVDALWDFGVFRAMLPQELGGMEMHPVDWIDLVYGLSRIDGSVGWLAAIHSGNGDLREPEVMRELTAGTRWLPAGSITHGGRARRVEGGYRVSGRWPFSTGLSYTTYITALSVAVDDDGQPVLDEAGEPKIVNGVFPMSDAAWGVPDTLGLRGTSSGWFALDDAFVPDRFVEPRYQMPRGYRRHPLHRAFWMLIAHAAHALGVAQGAIDAFVELSARKAAKAGASGEHYGREQVDKVALGRADALVRAGLALIRQATADAFEDARVDDPISYESEVRKEQANLFGVHAAKEAFRLILDQAGTEAVVSGTRFDRCLRDLSTISQHAATALKEFEKIGDYLLTRDDPAGAQRLYSEGVRMVVGGRRPEGEAG